MESGCDSTPSSLLNAAIFLALTALPCRAGVDPLHRVTGPNGVTVKPAFRGTILGFDIDPAGTQGLLSEFKDNRDGTILAATEIFDQATGEIVTIAARTNRHDDFITLGVVGGIDRTGRARASSRPFSCRAHLCGHRSACRRHRDRRLDTAFRTKQNIDQVRTDAGTSEVAVLALDFSGHGNNRIFTSMLVRTHSDRRLKSRMKISTLRIPRL